MSALSGAAYAWVKVFHIVAMVAWMAGIFYLPRLFVYHVDAKAGSDKSETFKVMERRLYSAIMIPAMIATWLAGIALALSAEVFGERWFMAKVALVALLTWYNIWLGARVRDFAEDRNTRSSRLYRIANELPLLLLIAVVALVVVRPF
jgi:putative membrane protein